MRYEGNIFRPPSEAYSLLIQVTIGCTHNKCTFCTMYKNEKFRVRTQEEVFDDLRWARNTYKRVERIFLCDGDALALSNNKLMSILTHIYELFPECERVSVYGRATDVLKKSEGEMRELYEAGLKIVYIGAESGSDIVLKNVCKNETRQQIIDGVKGIEKCGMEASVTFISGLAGREGWQDHAVSTGTMISEMDASYVGLLTLMIDPSAPIAEEIRSGRLHLLTPEEVTAETLLLLENTNVKKDCVFRSNHASNYVSLRGTLPYDKENMMNLLRRAMKDKSMFRDERFRAM